MCKVPRIFFYVCEKKNRLRLVPKLKMSEKNPKHFSKRLKTLQICEQSQKVKFSSDFIYERRNLIPTIHDNRYENCKSAPFTKFMLSPILIETKKENFTKTN